MQITKGLPHANMTHLVTSHLGWVQAGVEVTSQGTSLEYWFRVEMSSHVGVMGHRNKHTFIEVRPGFRASCGEQPATHRGELTQEALNLQRVWILSHTDSQHGETNA